MLCLTVAGRAAPVTVAVEDATARASAAAPANAALTGGSAPLPLRERIDREAIRRAIGETLTEAEANPRRYKADTIGATRYETFSKEFNEAKVPGCLGPNGLKRQPIIFLSGVLALPFVAVAKVRGKCR
jgi:pyruvate/2-oxoglutarate dehydrogenase complex dihydrolipoamide acyltransferase (E2) component